LSDERYGAAKEGNQMTPGNAALTRAHLKTPKAAAIAGIAFSVLIIVIFWLLRRSIPDDPLDSGACGLLRNPERLRLHSIWFLLPG
jgi:hypothetical protein